MSSRRSAAVAIAATLIAGTAWAGFGAATAVDGERNGRASYRDAMTEGTVHSVREARQLAAEAGLTGRTLVITAHDTNVGDINVPPLGGGGPSPGDGFVAEGRLYDAYHTERIGSQSRHCTIELSTFTCDRVFSLQGRGRIHTTSTAAFRGSLEFERGSAVTGGTGDFRAVRGDAMVFASGPHPNRDVLIVLQLVR